MSLAPTPSGPRGDLTLQPPFFTSSLFVDPFREDIDRLTDLFVQEFTDVVTQPFALFKRLWQEQGWTYMHLKIFDARTRHTYLITVCRLFVERLVERVEPIRRLVALFGLYTFYFTQPSGSRVPIYSIRQIDIAIDQYDLLLELPKVVPPALGPYASQVLSALITGRVFYILPVSRLEPYNPRTLPREVFVEDEEMAERTESVPLSETEQDHPVSGASTTRAGKVPPKKKGRPSKRDMAKKTKDAVAGLGRWLERTEAVGHAAGGGAGPSRARGHTHRPQEHGPTVSRANYRAQKERVLSGLLEGESGEGAQALKRANLAILGRLKKIDAMAAEKGMEVGGEGGESTGLGRVERAVAELAQGKPGILGLTEGAGRVESE
ncbi:hypothetical protein EDB87DRAFT_1804742 [Lactarius vividus]|nr:hypothetical protein EDB87DRAFT_1804742 [Lactarius vividus]